MKKIAIVTATRAEYGLLYPVIKELRKYESPDICIELIVTGTHLVKEYGETIKDIWADGVRIDKKIHISVKSDSRIDIANNQAESLKKFANLFFEENYTAVVILGDRYEMLMVAIAAVDMHIPIAHLYGGDTTEGAIDENIRHSISKMSYIHFATNEESRRRIIQLGENPDRVFNYGAPGTDNALNMEKFSKKDALESIGFKEGCKYAICTYHPVTLGEDDIEKQIMDFLDALSTFGDIQFIITKSNADQGGALINSILDRENEIRENIHVFASLGIKKYLSLMQYAEAVIGNSSSGIMEAPAFHVPTVNIGDRQKGRLQAESTINCSSDKAAIVEAINNATSLEMHNKCGTIISPYGDGTSSVKIAKKVIEVFKTPIDLKKKFYNVEGI